MKFNSWTINIEYDYVYEVLKNEHTLAILDKDNDLTALFKEVNNELKVVRNDYGNSFRINAEDKILTLEITNPFEDE
ncbi:hypothetical protein TP70_02075 [Staphylococcus microti]|uniref:Uncharacterized protein n=1 Tax=Staphylococcus microti TaxID=569857 RepID=A0A0D6XUG3_9STAP|nr:hypothetical protein [Staphylococcus microti]KIX91483.1 hypothetical protein TP70_02075 [Staphylococcus microti]PNZ77545.1 hypothetical protein CD132_10510 [Staphylococcus microti]SUM56425.1 Uncharacterised protein [Staphylococcus microti]